MITSPHGRAPVNRVSRFMRPAALMAALVSPLLLAAVPAAAQDQHAFGIAGYALALGPEPSTPPNSRWTRNYLAEIRLPSERAQKQSTRSPRRPSASQRVTERLARQNESADAIRQVVARESALWKVAHPEVLIANNLPALPSECGAEHLPDIRIVRADTNPEQPQQSKPLLSVPPPAELTLVQAAADKSC
ncbi:MAG: hypothetical protein AB8G23_04805 [Myxococcota bacterium]